MDKKEVKVAFDVKTNDYSQEELEEPSSYHKEELRLFKETITDIKYKQYKSISSKEVLILIAYLVAIVAAEVVTANYNVNFGLAMHTIILFALLINSSFTESSNFSNLLRSMMFLPMIRIIGLSMPIMQVEQLYWFPVISIPLFIASFTLIKTQKLTRKRVGLTLGNIPVQFAIALSGVILGFIEYLILKPQPLIHSLNLEALLIASIILIISTGFAEELLFRGILQKNTENILGKIYGLVYTSMLFTALHIGWNSIVDLLFVFSVAMFYGYMFQKTRSLFGITLSHGISNTFLFLIVPFIFPYLIHYI